MIRYGWIKSIRKGKGLTFLNVTDGNKDFQATINSESKVAGELKVGASFQASGEDSTTPNNTYEFLVSALKIKGVSDDSFPIQPKSHTMDYLRTIPEQRGRTKKFQAIWRIRHHLTQAIHRILNGKEFYQYYTPLITTADCEGAGETFRAKTDWMDANLTVSGQLHGEVGMMSLGKVYTFSPCFRAEKSATKKHLAEFWMVEPEMAFHEMADAMDLVEELLRDVVSDVVDWASSDFDILDNGMKILSKQLMDFALGEDWERVPYDDIYDFFMRKEGIPYGKDISSEIEQVVVEHYGGKPVFITHYPKDLKPFYMKKDEKHAYCFDLIFPRVGEMVGGSEREDDYEKLNTAMVEAGLDMDKMGWYLDTRKWGSVPHSGFGLGFERLLMFVTGVEKIHDVIPFPVSY